MILTGCNLPADVTVVPGDNLVATKVASTLTALTLTAGPARSITPTENLPGTPIPTTPAPLNTPTQTSTGGPSLTPTLTLKASNTPAASNTPIPDPGVIEGGISGYPYGALPGLSIVAYQQEAPYNYGFVITGSGQTYYVNNSNWLIPGHYQVVAYDSAGHSGGCPSLVLVKSNQSVTCDITSWGGGYRAKPADVPYP